MRKACLLASILLLGFTLRAATIVVHVERGAYSGPLTVHLGVPNEEHEPSWIAVQTAGAKDVRFESLQGGVYAVSLRGSQPAQKLTRKVVLGAADQRLVSLKVPATKLSARITHGGKPLAGVALTLEQEEWHWTARLLADPSGGITTPLWDQGAFLLDLRDGGLGAPVKLRTTLTGADVASLLVDLPSRRIRGTVVDASGSPLPKARVVLRTERAGITAPIAVLTDARGRFEFPGIEPGRQLLRVTADGYLAADALTIMATKADEVIEREIRLAGGRPLGLELVDAKGKPVVGATLLSSSDGHVRAIATSGDDGRARIATPATGTCVVWVVPREGSLTAVPFNGAAGSSRRVVVPEGTAALDIETLLRDGTPLPNVSLLMRFNGELVPPDVGRMLRRGGNSLSTNEDGRAELARIPPGTYEFWPYMTDDEAEALVASAAPGKAPVNVNVSPGRQRATIRFDKRH